MIQAGGGINVGRRQGLCSIWTEDKHGGINSGISVFFGGMRKDERNCWGNIVRCWNRTA